MRHVIVSAPPHADSHSLEYRHRHVASSRRPRHRSRQHCAQPVALLAARAAAAVSAAPRGLRHIVRGTRCAGRNVLRREWRDAVRVGLRRRPRRRSSGSAGRHRAIDRRNARDVTRADSGVDVSGRRRDGHRQRGVSSGGFCDSQWQRRRKASRLRLFDARRRRQSRLCAGADREFRPRLGIRLARRIGGDRGARSDRARVPRLAARRAHVATRARRAYRPLQPSDYRRSCRPPSTSGFPSRSCWRPPR